MNYSTQPMNYTSSTVIPSRNTKELPQFNENKDVLEQAKFVPSQTYINRNIPVFSSESFPTSQNWGQWFLETQFMEYVADPEIPPLKPHNNTSMTFRTSGEYHPTMRIGGINGIGNSLCDAILHSEYLKKFTNNLAVEWVYNCSNNPIVDAVEAAALNMSGHSPNTSDLLKENWTAFHEENRNNPNAKYLQHCHSQGAIHVNNALESLSKEIRNRIIVVAIAPAVIVPKALCYQSYNYASKFDIVPYAKIFVVTAQKTINTLTGLPGSVFDKQLEDFIDLRNELILLDPHPSATGIDHDYQGLTYLDKIEYHNMEYLNNNGIYND